MEGQQIIIYMEWISDLQILRTWVERRTKARTFTAADAVLNQGPDAVVYGVVRVFLNDRLLYQK